MNFDSIIILDNRNSVHFDIGCFDDSNLTVEIRLEIQLHCLLTARIANFKILLFIYYMNNRTGASRNRRLR